MQVQLVPRIFRRNGRGLPTGPKRDNKTASRRENPRLLQHGYCTGKRALVHDPLSQRQRVLGLPLLRIDGHHKTRECFQNKAVCQTESLRMAECSNNYHCSIFDAVQLNEDLF